MLKNTRIECFACHRFIKIIPQSRDENAERISHHNAPSDSSKKLFHQTQTGIVATLAVLSSWLYFAWSMSWALTFKWK